jgi:competence protein ComEC
MAAETSPSTSRRSLYARALLLLAALTALAWHSRPDGRLHVIFPAVEGDAALIRTPAGGFILVDGGADPAALTAALGRAMPFWQRNLEAVVLASPDSRRLPGQVAALARYHAGIALALPASSRSPTFAEWQRLLQEQGTPIRIVQPGARLAIGGAQLTVLAADEDGLLLHVAYGRTCALLAHALPAATDPPTRLCDLLAFPWERDPRTPFVASTRARHILFTDGEHSDAPPELTYLERAIGGAHLYHERLDGTVEWVSDGQATWMLTNQ